MYKVDKIPCYSCGGHRCHDCAGEGYMEIYTFFFRVIDTIPHDSSLEMTRVKERVFEEEYEEGGATSVDNGSAVINTYYVKETR